MTESTASATSNPKALRQTLRRSDTYYAKGFPELQETIRDELQTQYKSTLVETIRANGYTYTRGDVTIKLAQSFGFCWGVERAIEYAYEARRRFPDRQLWITNEIIHNPQVNQQLSNMGVRFVVQQDGVKDFSKISPGDVILWPAFGASLQEMEFFQQNGNEIVDTTCPWVSRVWNQVDKHRTREFTSIIHGKYAHEETIATSSFADKYLIVLDMEQARYVAHYILHAADDPAAQPELRTEFMQKFEKAMSAGFDPNTDLERVGIANQTTMLEGETKAIAKLFETTMLRKYGPQELDDHFISFNTICNATQERQDAMFELVEEPLDLMVVIGGFNSSNTTHLQEIATAKGLKSFHIDGPACIRDDNSIRHQTLHGGIQISQNWLPAGAIAVGVTSGASTPDRMVSDAIERIFQLKQ
ncbi:4-hydroxy-3-methylbut-2-enyl diphosphate reductase [Synechococcus sp. PCC 7336]|uniref:4-hydroxy-3-methylbut-2-enyl diphosphate reductase n=1 Tax=Synechococcus sp. PCC 7336 TaxID=195250 RepID=UPI00047724BB|nr:4-hydroxy-3-methylbut-2-enyl diphosphate reductase [Synechococcus sp. PCC 7336]